MTRARVLRRLGAIALGVLALALVGVLLEAPRTDARGQAISGSTIATELARAYHYQLLGQGYDYEPSMTCTQTGARSFTCVGYMRTAEIGLLQSKFQVACLAEGTAPGERCWTDTGLALQ